MELLTDGMTHVLYLFAALRSRGFTPESIKTFVELVGVTKSTGLS